jgi:hypothetical protein
MTALISSGANLPVVAMGNGSSSGSFHISTEKQVYRGGEMVYGVVNLMLRVPTESDGVFLKVRRQP